MIESQIKTIIDKLKPNYQGAAVIYLATAGGIGLGIAINPGFYILGGLFLVLSVYIINNTKKQRAQYTWVGENFEYEKDEVMVIIDKQIKQWRESIAREERKANAGGRDAVDSADDAVRKTKTLKLWKALKEAIEEFHKVKLSDPFE